MTDTNMWALYKSYNDSDYVIEHVLQKEPLPFGIRALDNALSPTGSAFDAMGNPLGGLPSGIPTVVAGEPGCGKSALAIISSYNAVSRGKLPMFFTIEMPRQMVLSRLLSVHTAQKRAQEERRDGSPSTHQVWWSTTGNVVRKNAGHIITDYDEATRYVNDHYAHDYVIQAWDDFSTHVYPNMMVIDSYVNASTGETSPRLTCDRICEMVRNVHTIYPNVYPIIDYLQLTLTGSDSEYNDVNEASGMYRSLAKELDIPLLLISSMRKAGVNERKEPPSLSQLKGSGNIGYDAGTVIMLRRDDDQDTDKHSSETHITAHVVKNRVGKPNIEAPLIFNGGLNAYR